LDHSGLILACPKELTDFLVFPEVEMPRIAADVAEPWGLLFAPLGFFTGFFTTANKIAVLLVFVRSESLLPIKRVRECNKGNRFRHKNLKEFLHRN
jgi:hypothetical protein